MPLTWRIEKMTPADRLVVDKLEREATLRDKSPTWPGIALAIGACSVLLAFRSPPANAFVVMAMIVGGATMVVMALWVFIEHLRSRDPLSRFKLRMLQKGIAQEDVIAGIIEADLVIPLPGLFEDCDSALFRINPDEYVILDENTLSHLPHWLDGRFPKSIRLRQLVSGDLLLVEVGSEDARVDSYLPEKGCERIAKYVEELVEDSEKRSDPFTIIPRRVIEEARSV